MYSLQEFFNNNNITVNILLVDDHVLFRAGMRYLLRRFDARLSLDEAGDCAEGLQHLTARRYDLVLLDLHVPCTCGPGPFDALDCLHEASHGTPLVMISGEEDPRVIRATIEHGAMGFIPKSSTPELLSHAISLVLANGVYLPRSVLDAVQLPPQPDLAHAEGVPPTLQGLTQRQMEVLRGVISGKANKAIAQELNLSDATVKAHLTLTYRALGVVSRTEAIYAAAKLGLRLA